MPRSWDSAQDTTARAEGADSPNVDALHDAVKDAPKWTVDDVLTELGGTGKDASTRLSRKMLEARGMDVNAKSIENQRRSINRWLAFEAGQTGKEVRDPNKGTVEVKGERLKVSTLLSRIGRNAQAARDGFDIAMSGDIGVNGYRRRSRSANIHMQGDAAAAWLENPTYEGLAQFYEGNAIEAFGDVRIDIQL